MGQARRGRPRKAGARNAKGRLILLPDRGNIRVQARSAAFARFQSGRADQQVADQIGRAWAVGLLDGLDHDAAILRDIGRRYGGLYWHEYARLDALARQAGRDAVAAMHGLCVDGWWFPDTNAPWVERLIQTAIYDAGGQPLGERASASDRARMMAAAEALAAMVEGRQR